MGRFIGYITRLAESNFGHMEIRVTLILVSLLLSGCVAQNTKTYRGHLSIWPEAEVFTPCESDIDLWLDYDMKTRGSLAKQHWKLQKEPYGTTFAVLKGEIGPKLDCGFCENYEGSFKVLDIEEHRASSSDDCKP